MNVYDKLTDMFTYDIKATSILRNLLVLLVLMTFGATNAWADDYSGTYYVASYAKVPNSNPAQYFYDPTNPTNSDNYYLCPSDGWIYYKKTNNWTADKASSDGPFLTTFKCRTNAYDAQGGMNNAKWIVTKHGDYYTFYHTGTSKYLVLSGQISECGVDRMRVHLETIDSPETNDNALFTITSDSNPGFCIAPKTIPDDRLTVNGGNKNNLIGNNGKTGGPSGYTNTAGIIGIYRSTGTDDNRYFYLEDVPIPTPTFTVNADGTVAISCSEAGTTIHYTLDGSEPTKSSAVYSSALPSADVLAVSSVKAIAVRTIGSQTSDVATLPVITYNYHIVNVAKNIAITATEKHPAGYPLTSGYDNIPAAIRSSYISDETINFYTMEGAFDASNLDDEHKITATPETSADIYVTYTTENLGSKFVKVSGSTPYNLTYSTSGYIYDTGSAVGFDATYDEGKMVTNPYLWYFEGDDPYDVQIRNAKESKYMTSSSSVPTRSDAAVKYILTGQSDVDATHKTITLKNLANSETVTLTANTVVLPISYTLIDMAGYVIKSNISYVEAEGFGLPAAWKSPLVDYQYWNADAFVGTDGTPNVPFVFKDTPTPSEITSATQVTSNNVIYVTYTLKTDNTIDLDGRNLLNAPDKEEGTTYMLRFNTPNTDEYKFYQEDGKDGVMTEKRRAVYPYSNGDCTLYVYGEERWEEQLASGASTRTRWLWYLEPSTSKLDPYHVRVSSYQNQTNYTDPDTKKVVTNFHSYLWTYIPTGYSKVVTGVVNNNPLAHGASASEDAVTDLPEGSEYMLLGTSTSSLKLVTFHEITGGNDNGVYGKRQTIHSLEQYWKNNPTVQKKLTTKVTTVGRNVTLEDQQSDLTALGWHSYKAWANSAPWVHNNDASGGKLATTSKKFLEEEHVFQTIEMGESFQLVPTELKTMLILLDQHGWEIVRLPLPSGPDDPKRKDIYADIHKYNSPMVARYHFWKTGTKVPGYHKFKVSNYATVSDVDLTEYTADELGRADITNPLTPPNLPNYETQAKVDGKERDWYVTYDVKPEYASTYAGAATKVATSAAKFLIKQGGHYAKNSSNTIVPTTSSEEDGLTVENASEDLQWYLKPNFDIDEEMGYIYVDNPGAQAEAEDKDDTEYNDYVNPNRSTPYWSNGFDPYNVQIQSVSNTARYFTANTTGSTVTSSWTGTSSAITLENMGTSQTIIGLDQTNMKITNSTFIVIDDGNGNMRLMPRFDHTKVMQTFTTLAAQADAALANDNGAGNQSLYLTLVPKVVENSSEIDAMGGYYILANNFTASGSVGTKEAPFKGIIEGQIGERFSVSDPFISYAEDAVIRNIIIESATVSGDTIGAIVNQAKGNTRIYNCGVNGGTVSGTKIAGSIVGHLDGSSRVINCYSYADVSGGDHAGGIVGYNAFASTQANLRTMVMNCMFYGDITGGSNKSPVYGGLSINNLNSGGLNTFNYYSYDDLAGGVTEGKYNCALAVEEKNLKRFEFYRLLLNSNKKLAAIYATGDAANANQMAKWVLETADRSIDDPKPYPVLKAQGYYPSIINYDVTNAPDSATVGRNNGGKLGKTLTVTISGVGSNAPSGVSISEPSLLIDRMDKDTLRFNYNYDKIQLPYYNDVGTGNYTKGTDDKCRVVTGWKITGMTGGTAGTYTAADNFGGYNFADRKCKNKDIYGTGGSNRVFSQGAYFDVPYGVTAIEIEPYWGHAAFVADASYDIVYNTSYASQSVSESLLGTQVDNNTTYNGQKVYTNIADALATLSGSTVYDNAIVLVGNLHQGDVPSNGDKAFTVMSVDEDKDNEPDYSMIYHHTGRTKISPIRFDFINIPGTAQAQKPKDGDNVRNFTIFKTRGWFETTNTCLVYSNQVEYENQKDVSKLSNSPLILLGGDFEQFVSTQSDTIHGRTNYIHVGGNVHIQSFGLGTHGDGSKSTPHIPVSVTGGSYDGFYLSGTYNQDANVRRNDNAECYISGGYFKEAAGACQEKIDGDVHWQIYDADIDAFFGGGINAARPITGNVTTDIYNSHVTVFCGGPKFGDMQSGKKVTTNAEGCVFGKYFGGGYGGTSYSRKKYYDSQTTNWSGWANTFKNDRGKYFDGLTTNAVSAQYGKKGIGVATDFEYEFFVWSSGGTGGRLYVNFASFSLATCNDVESNLKGCTVEQDFYGGGSYGEVKGKATSVLDGCTVLGNVFGGGYSATLPKINVRGNQGFTKTPNFNKSSGMFEPGTITESMTVCDWENASKAGITLTNNQSGSKLDSSPYYVYTDVDLDNLGKVGATDLTIKGNTSVAGRVYGGGDMSAVTPNPEYSDKTIKGDTKVNIQNAGGNIIPYVYGGGNTADVDGNTEVNITSGTVSQDVYGGGRGETTKVGGDVTVNVGAKSGVELSGSGLVEHDVYGGSALGKVNTTADKKTFVNVYAGTVNGSVFGGGLGQVAADAVPESGTPGTPGYVPAKDAVPAIVAENQGATKVNMEGGTVKTAVYGGSNVNGVLTDSATVTVIGGTIGTSWTTPVPSPLPDVVFGGGKGEPTLVNGDVTVSIGTLTNSAYTGAATIYGNVYGGSALGNTNASKPASDLVFNDTKKTNVYLYGGTVYGNVFGGGLGQKNGENGATSDIISYVGGDVNVLLDGVTLSKDDGTGQIFGCNNLNGTPKGHVKVHVKRTKNIVAANNKKYQSEATLEQRTTYDVNAVYGGGNKADYVPADPTPETPLNDTEDFAEVIIEGCDTTAIQYVYGGGNAAAVPATQITIESAYIIDQLFGGGNGAGEGNPGADVGVIDKTAYEANHANGIYGTGKAVTKMVGGQVHVVYGGSNTKGNVRGGTSLERKGSNSCALKIGEIYGAGQVAPMDGDVNIILECMPESFVEAVYGGAKNAVVNGNVSLTVTSGKYGRVFGGNNLGGSINGSITVNAYEEGCRPLIIGELYGGGFKAPYSIYGCYEDNGTWTANESGPLKFDQEAAKRTAVEVNVYSCTSIGKVFGGGFEAPVIGNTRVWINTMTGHVDTNDDGISEEQPIGKIGQVFGGGNAATVKGNTTIDIGTATADEGEKIGIRLESGTYLSPSADRDTTITAGIYGGGFSADVEGDVMLNIGTVEQNQGINIGGDIFGGGYGETTTVKGDVVVNIGKRTNTALEGDPVYTYEGYANITGDVYGGSAKGKVNATKGGTVESPTFSATADKSTQVNLYGGTIKDTDPGTGKGNIYGGGLGEDNEGTTNDYAADVYGPVTVNIEGGKVVNVFGCNNVLGSPQDTVMVNIHGMAAPVEPATYTISNVYGGGKDAAYTGSHGVRVAMTNGWVNDVFGGGLGATATVNGTTSVSLTGGKVTNDVYGGGSLGSVTGTVNVTLNGTTVAQNLYGGGLGRLANGNDPEAEGYLPAVAANIGGAVKVAVISGTATNVFGCNNVNGMPTSTVDVEIGTKTGEEAPYTYGGTATISNSVYGGGNMAASTSSPAVKIYGGTINNNVYGGGLGATAVTGGSSVTMEGGSVKNDVYGGGSLADVTGNVAVVIAGGTVTHDVYGGGALANTNTGNWDEVNDTWKVSKNDTDNYYLTVKHLTAGSSSVTGFYTDPSGSPITDSEAKAAANTTYYKQITLKKDIHDIAENGTTYTTTVLLTGGHIGNAYGGGLGRLTSDGLPTGEGAVKAMVYGDVSVTVNGATFTADVEPSAKNAPVNGRVFGCNNINGTPKGKVQVRIQKTQRIDGGEHTLGEFEIQGVYGGGNLSDYEPETYDADTEFGQSTKVIIDDCEASISKVYGGGNAASVPFTNVTVNGAFEIGYVFGGGNGGDMIYKNGSWVDNTGANVDGYTYVLLKGGTIGQAFGGSDSKGNVRGSDIRQESGGLCPLRIVNLYGAGNGEQAKNEGDITVTISGCGENNEIQNVYGGSYKANITGNVTLNIKSGIFTNVFGGNDRRGSIGGNITVNIEETDDCDKPIIIQNLYGGCYQTAYPGESNQDEHTPAKDKEGNDFTTGKITVNVKSATRIDRIFGGSERGEVTGDTEVNINMVKGSMSGHSNVTLPSYYTESNHPSNVTVNPAMGYVAAYVLIEDGKDRSSVDGYYTRDQFTAATGTAAVGTTYYQENDGDYTTVTPSPTVGDDVSSYYIKEVIDYTAVTGEAKKGFTYYKKVVQGSIADKIGTIGTVYGGGNIGKVTGSTVINIGTVETVTMETVDADNPATEDINEKTPKVLGARIDGDVFGGCYNAVVTGSTEVNICTADYSGTTGFEDVNIEKGSVYGGGNMGDVLGNTNVTMSGGYVFNGIFGGGLAGSVGTFTTRSTSVTDYGHVADHSGCIGKPTVCASGTGKCTVVVNGGQIGPVTVATEGMPVPQGWVWGGGCGLIEDPAKFPDTHFKTYVGSTDVTIGGTAFIMEGVIGGGEFGRVLGNTHVTIEGNCQIGVGAGKAAAGKPVAYTSEQWTEAAAAVVAGDASRINTIAEAMPECHHWDYESPFEAYDPYYETAKYATTHIGPASTSHPTDGKTWIGVVFGGGSGYMPYEKDDGSGYDWCKSAGWVEGNTLLEIKGGHILTNAYGGNEITDVKGHCVVKMTGGTIGLPRKLTDIEAHPVTCYLFGGGKGDQRSHFNNLTNVGSTKVEVSGGIIYGSVFGGAEDGHILGNDTVVIKSSAWIGTWGTSYVDGNVFGGGRGFSGETLTAGNVGGNVMVDVQGGTMLGSIYGGGRLGSVGLDLGTATMQEGDTHGHVTVNISGGTIGNSYEYKYYTFDIDKSGKTVAQIEKARKDALDAQKVTDHIPNTDFELADSVQVGETTTWTYIYRLKHTKGGNVYVGGMGRLYALDGTTPLEGWKELGKVKKTTLTISGTDTKIKGNVYGGGEFGFVNDDQINDGKAIINIADVASTITISGSPTIGSEVQNGSSITQYTFGSVYGGGYGSTIENIYPTDDPTTENDNPKFVSGRTNGSTSITMSGGTVKASIFGGGEVANVRGSTSIAVSGGSIGLPKDETNGIYFGGATMGNVYGGGNGSRNIVRCGQVFGNATINISGTPTIYHNIYGGGAYGSVGDINWTQDLDPIHNSYKVTGVDGIKTPGTGKATITITGGTIGIDGHENGMVFGSSRGEVTDPGKRDDFMAFTYDTDVTIGTKSAGSGPTIKGSVYGSGENGHVWHDTDVKVYSGTIGDPTEFYDFRGNVYGAGCGTDQYDSDGDGTLDAYRPTAGIVNGNTSVTIDGGQVANCVYGAGAMGSVKGNTSITISGSAIIGSDTDGSSEDGNVFGAARGEVGVTNTVGATNNYAYVNNTSVTISGGQVKSSVYGGGMAGIVKGSVVVNMNGGTVGDNVYGGGALADSNTSNWDVSTSGWAAGKTSASATTTVNLKGGTVTHEAYGGALGRFAKDAVGDPGDPGYVPAVTEIAPNVYGDILVELNKGKTASSNGCIVEKVFGCNDLNGTPKGHAKVHVYATQRKGTSKIVPDDGKYAKFGNVVEDYSITNYSGLTTLAEATGTNVTAYTDILSGSGTTDEKNKALADMMEAIADDKYDVLAVYGGGDLAMYNPTDPNENTEVIIDGCALTSIKQVYGGGNAASTPANVVRINECYEIHEAFGGGNGKDDYEIGGKYYKNLGANIGYKATFSSDTSDPAKGTQVNPYPAVAYADADTPEERRANTSYHYGKGTAHLIITGGRVHSTYGGSNMKGNVRAEAVTSTEDAGDCTMLIDVSTAAGKNADTDGGARLDSRCVDYQAAIYGGSTDANVYNDVVINITNGTYGKIFGGNNLSGKIYGSITINVREEGCKPIVIDSLFAGGNKADYSIYGFNDDGSARTKAQYDDLTPAEQAKVLQRNPQINIISATRIGTIYGGAYKAKVIGSPSVNVNMEEGFVAAKYATDAKYDVGYHEFTDHSLDCSYHVLSKDAEGKAILKIGTIGTIFGGGSLGDIYGDTRVDIGTGKHFNFAGEEEVITPARNAAFILGKVVAGKYVGGQVYGGGDQGYVFGNSTVNIANGYIYDRVYGGGKEGTVGEVSTRAALPAGHTSHPGCLGGKPSAFATGTGRTAVTVSGGYVGPFIYERSASTRVATPASMTMPEDYGYVFGAGRGELTNPATDKDIDFRTYVDSTEVIISDSALIAGGVYGGSENGRVLRNTHVNIRGGQIGLGAGQTTAYDEANFIDPTTATAEEITAKAALMPECAAWPYGKSYSGTMKWLPYDEHADESGYDAENYGEADGTGGSDGHTFYGNVFGGGSGYFTYPLGDGKYEWLPSAGLVEGDTYVNISGGHILTNVYGGNEMTNINGNSHVTMTGGTLGVPRTLAQIAAHPVTCYLFGGGKGDQRVHFNKSTNVGNAKVNVSGGIIYGSVFGGGEDGHVMRNSYVTISDGAKIGTWGTSYVDGNVFGGGRGFGGDAYTAGNVAGTVTLNITGGTMLGSIYGGGRLASVGYGLYMKDEIETTDETGKHLMYGAVQDDGYGDWYKNSSDEYVRDAIEGFRRGHVEINISGDNTVIGNKYEYQYISPGTTGAALATAKANMPYTELESNNRLKHTKGGNVFAGGMGRYTQLDGTTPISSYTAGTLTSPIEWKKLGNVKSTKLTISGNPWIMGNVYGGGEFGAVQGYHTLEGKNYSTEILFTGGTVGTEITTADPQKETIKTTASRSTVQYTFGSIYGGGMGQETPDDTGNHGGDVKDSTYISMSSAASLVRASVYGGGEMAIVEGNTRVNISDGKIGRKEVKPLTDKSDVNAGYVLFGSATMGNVYGGGKGALGYTTAGQVKGNTNVNITGGEIYHMVYGGGALGSVGDFKVSDGADHPSFIPYAGIPYGWDTEADGETSNGKSTGIATVTITGGTIGISGRDNGLVFGSSRGDLMKPYDIPDDGTTDELDPYDRVAWVNKSVVTIGTAGQGNDAPQPQIKGSVYGGGENGHNNESATVNVYSGTIGIADIDDPYYDFDGNAKAAAEAQIYRGNVYGGGSGSDMYDLNGDGVNDSYNPKSGMVGGNTVVNIAGGHIGRSVYGGGAMASVGTITNWNDTTGVAKHASEDTSFALSWPYKFVFAPGTGKATVNVTGGHIGTRKLDGGDVYGSSRGVAGDRYMMAHLAWTDSTEVNINYPETIDMTSEDDIQNDFTKQCITGSVHGSGENGYVYDDTKVTLYKGLIGHSLYGGGKGNGTYKMKIDVLVGEGKTEHDIYGLLSGRVMGNTYVTMYDGHVLRNVYGGGNMGSVGKGNYAGGADDYYQDGYGEKIEGNLWTSSETGDDAWQFLNSGKTFVNVFGGTVGYINAADPTKSMKNDLPYGNVIGGSAGEAAPNIAEMPRYLYSPAFFSGYVNETDVNIGGYKCTEAYSTYHVGDSITAAQFDTIKVAYKGKWEQLVGPTILASVYGGGQDGHVRRWTHVTIGSGTIGIPYNDANKSLLQTADFNDPQWLYRGNVYGAGSGITKYAYDFNGNGKTHNESGESEVVTYQEQPTKEEDYSTSAGSVTHFTTVDVLGGTIYRNVLGGGSLASVGPPKIDQPDYAARKTATAADWGRQSLNLVNVGGAKDGSGNVIKVKIGEPKGVAAGYGGHVFGGSRGDASLGSEYGSSIWTEVNIKNGAIIHGDVFGGGNAGEVMKNTEVKIGEKAVTP